MLIPFFPAVSLHSVVLTIFIPIFLDERKQVMAENTYLLALDGDIDFQPEAVTRLVDLMKKNKNLGAACGRIHPTGSGIYIIANYQIIDIM